MLVFVRSIEIRDRVRIDHSVYLIVNFAIFDQLLEKKVVFYFLVLILHLYN